MQLQDTNASIYVAGHRGLVGSAVVHRLRAAGYDNLITRTSKELDLRDQSATRTFFEQQKPEFVVLAAAKVGGILANDRYPADFIGDNLIIQDNVIRAAHDHNVRRLVFLGSSCIYPKHAPQPLNEEYLLTGPLEPTNEWYAIAKIAGTKLCEALYRQHGDDFITLMPTNLYGPRDNFDPESSHVLPALIRKFHESLGETVEAAATSNGNGPHQAGDDSNARGAAPYEKGENGPITKPRTHRQAAPIHDPRSPTRAHAGARAANSTSGQSVTLWGTGTPRREFLYSEDLADAVLFILQAPKADLHAAAVNGMLNVGVGEDITITGLAELIRDVVGSPASIEFDTTKPDGTPRKLLDVRRMTELGWTAKTPLREGVRKAYEWYLAHAAAARRDVI